MYIDRKNVFLSPIAIATVDDNALVLYATLDHRLDNTKERKTPKNSLYT